MTTSKLTNESEIRLGVVNLRLRIEQLAKRAVSDAFPTQTVIVAQTNIRSRLAFVIVAYESRAETSELLGLVRLARHIYKRTSDVLHGRSSMVNLPVVLLDEWKTIVVRLETIALIEPSEV